MTIVDDREVDNLERATHAFEGCFEGSGGFAPGAAVVMRAADFGDGAGGVFGFAYAVDGGERAVFEHGDAGEGGDGSFGAGDSGAQHSLVDNLHNKILASRRTSQRMGLHHLLHLYLLSELLQI